jgi:hypothetical protein
VTPQDCLISQNINVADMFRQVGALYGSNSKGAKPPDLPAARCQRSSSRQVVTVGTRRQFFKDAVGNRILSRRMVRRPPFPCYCLSHLEALEFRMLQIERSGCVIAGACVGGAERIRFSPRLEGSFALPY